MFDFSPDETTRRLLDTVRGFVRTELFLLEEEVEREGTLAPERAAEIFAKARALGLYAMNMPAELGGGDLSAVQVCLVEEQFGHTKDILSGVRSATPARCCWSAAGSSATAGCGRWCGGSGSAPSRSPSRGPGPTRPGFVFRIYDGTSEIHRGIIARGLLARGVEAVLPK